MESGGVKNRQRRLFFIFSLIILTFILFLAAYNFNKEVHRQYEKLRSNEAANIESGRKFLTKTIHSLISDIQTIGRLSEASIDAGRLESRRLSSALKQVALNKQFFPVIQLIDQKRYARLQISYNPDEGSNIDFSPAYINDTQLWVRLKQLKRNGVFISAVKGSVDQKDRDLVTSHSYIHLATPLYGDNGARWGYLLVKYRAEVFLHEIFHEAVSGLYDHAMVIDSEGFFLHHPFSAREWGQLFGTDDNASKLWPAFWEKSKDLHAGQVVNKEGIFTFATIYPLQDEHANVYDREYAKSLHWKIVSHVPTGSLADIREDVIKKLLLIGFPVFLVFIYISYWSAGFFVRKRLEQDALEYSKRKLDEKVEERTSELNREIRKNVRLVRELKKQNVAVESSPAGIIITNPAGKIEYANHKVEEISGYSANQLKGENPSIFKSDLTHKSVYKELWSTIVKGEVWEGEVINKSSDGSLYWEHLQIIPVYNKSNTRITHYIGYKKDITLEKQLNQGLRLAASVFKESSEGILITDKDGLIISVNHTFCEITGYSEAEIYGKNPSILQSGRHDAAFYKKMWKTIENAGQWQGEIYNRKKDGTIYPEWLNITRVRDEKGEITHYIGMFIDVSDRKKAEEKIKHLAFYDNLTELPNKYTLMQHLRYQCKLAVRSDQIMSILMVDLDGFKNINDSLGHVVGDTLLVEVAKRIQSCVPEGELVGRFGGDEFIVVFHQPGETLFLAKDKSIEMARKITHQIKIPFRVGEHELLISSSTGIVLFPKDGTDADDLIRHADTAMYKAKELGRNTFCFFEQDMDEELNQRIQMETALRSAIEKDQFSVEFQPQVDIGTGNLVGAESLIRWNHPEWGNIAPVEFIQLAEDTGQIIGIGQWVLKTVFQLVADWHDQGVFPEGFRVAVNISPRQFQHVEFIDQVKLFIEVTGVDPQMIEMEVTEGVFISHINDITNKLIELKSLGFRISIDDFGTGYSSLNYLKRLPFDSLKIDQSFVRDIPGDINDAAIVKTIIGMAKSLHLTVVAEGVENGVQLQFLQDLGCAYYQGYYFSTPIPVAGFSRFLAELNQIGKKNYKDYLEKILTE